MATSRATFSYPEGFLLSIPIYAYARTFDVPYKLHKQEFWWSLGSTHLLAWIFLLLASVILPRAWQDRPKTLAGFWRERWYRWRFGEGAQRAAFRERLLAINPFLWLASRDRFKPHYVFAMLGLAGIAWVALYWKFRHEMLDFVTFVFTAIIIHTLLKFWLAAEACRQFAEDRRSGALELLLSTPLSVLELLRGQLLALNRQFMGGVVMVLLMDLLMFLTCMRDRFVTGSSEGPLLFFSGILMFVADLCALAWVGMWLGLTSKTVNRAAGAAIVRVLVLPWILYVGLLTILALAGLGQSTESDTFLIGSWFVIGLGNALLFLTLARRNLLEHLRVLATVRFDTGKSRSIAPRAREAGTVAGESQALTPAGQP